MAEGALDALGWRARKPLLPGRPSFADLFAGKAPRPLQQALAEEVEKLDQPAVILVEAPMGEGKTEAAWQAHMLARAKFGHRGLYVALPSQATGNAMFTRVKEFLQAPGLERGKARIDLQLLHAQAFLNREFQSLRPPPPGADDDSGSGPVVAAAWFSQRKRALLSEYGVGTVDQALLAILPAKHHFVRLWGLANRVVALDEVHAYDAYTSQLLLHLVHWLYSLGSTVLLLSATMHPAFRRDLAKRLDAPWPEAGEAAYPRLTIFQPGRPLRQRNFAANPDLRRVIRLERVEADLGRVYEKFAASSTEGAALALVNTVDRAQALYNLFPPGELLRLRNQVVGKRLADGTRVYLFHARFPADQRQAREERLLEEFGKKAENSSRRILIATQAAEQSLDLDFDVMFSDLAPIDLLLQRAGRLWRFQRAGRPYPAPALWTSGLAEAEPPDFGGPLWWRAVYYESLLLSTWRLLRQRSEIVLPDDIDRLVAEVYENEPAMSDDLLKRYEEAKDKHDGENYAHWNLSAAAMIASPDAFLANAASGAWFEDEDAPWARGKKIAPTRLGEESAVIVPIEEKEPFDPNRELEPEQARAFVLRSLRVSRQSLVAELRKTSLPPGWRTSPFLRDAYAFRLDANRAWIKNAAIVLDEELGLRYN
ncbi:MAG: CRISPR-associated helicase Cas3' [Candidatus Adiutrix sp.]|jgi:CRISPR-associated endonuclease/helicase Cas3|nr:CRISPR-associated helicase Cas3' [Candidatus Adiutrix sp.]